MRITAIITKEIIHILRDARMLYFAIIWPVLLLLLFGYTVSFNVKNIRLLFVDFDRSRESREFLHTLEASGSFEIDYTTNSSRTTCSNLLKQGVVKAVITIPKGFNKKISRGEEAEFQLIIDGGDSNTARVFLGYILGASQYYREKIITERYSFNAAMPIDSRIKFLYNPSLRSQNFVVPGLIAVILMIIGTLITSSTIAREWDRRTMEQLFYTPIKAHELIFGKLFPYLVIGLLQTTLVLLTGIMVFNVPFKGSIILYYTASILFLLGALGLGLFLSLTAKSQQIATMLAFLTSVLPAFLLSGFIFPISSMPFILRGLSYLVPAKYFLNVIRGVFLKDSGITTLWSDFLAMFLFASFFLGISIIRFKKRIS